MNLGKPSEISKGIEKYEQEELGLSKIQKIREPEVLRYSVVQIHNLSQGDLLGYQFEIEKYLLFLQRKINRQRAWRVWAVSQREELLAVALPSVRASVGYGQQEKIALQSTEPLKKIHRFIGKIDLKLCLLGDIIPSIRSFVKILDSARYLKAQKEKHNNG